MPGLSGTLSGGASVFPLRGGSGAADAARGKSMAIAPEGRRALDAWDLERAVEVASEAQQVQRTESGEALRLLSMWLRGAMSGVATPMRPNYLPAASPRS